MRNVLIFILSFLLWNSSFSQTMQSRTEIIDVEKSNAKLTAIELNPASYISINIKYSRNLETKLNYKVIGQKNSDWIQIKDDIHSDEKHESNDFLSALIILGTQQKQITLSYEGANNGLLEIEIIEDDLNALESEKSNFINLENCICPPASFINRTSWGCPWGDESPNFIPVESEITHFVIHHQGGNAFPPYDATVRAIWSYHVNSNGWEDIGYHWLIDPDGIIYKGRAWLGENENVLGAHMCGCNANKLGICLLGDFTDQGPTNEQYSSLIDLITYKCCTWNISPELESLGTDRTSGNCQVESLNNIISHRDGCPNNYTECPGAFFYSQFNQVKNDIKTSYLNCMLNTNTNEQKSESLILYPNPITSDFIVKGIFKKEEIEIYDLHGREIKYITRSDSEGLQLTILAPSGTYIVKSKTNPAQVSKLTKL